MPRHAPITVLTVTIPGREQSLARTIASVNAQTVPVFRQLVCSHPVTRDPPMVQYVTAKNSLLPAVVTDWVAVLNDDDTWLPHHVRTMLPHLDGADVVYSWDAGRTRPRENCNEWDQREIAETLDKYNFIDGNCLIRRSTLIEAGGFPADFVEGGYEGSVADFEDWELWRRLNLAGAVFRCVPVETWRYDFALTGRISNS